MPQALVQSLPGLHEPGLDAMAARPAVSTTLRLVTETGRLVGMAQSECRRAVAEAQAVVQAQDARIGDLSDQLRQAGARLDAALKRLVQVEEENRFLLDLASRGFPSGPVRPRPLLDA